MGNKNSTNEIKQVKKNFLIMTKVLHTERVIVELGSDMMDGWVDGWMDGWMDVDRTNYNC